MVANLMAQIQNEYDSSRQAIEGLAQGAAKHEFITARAERIAIMVSDIGAKYGDDIAMQVMKSLPPDQPIESPQ